jgi:hypothetical protein
MNRWAVSLRIGPWLAAAVLATSTGCGPSTSPTAPGRFTPPADNPAPAPQPENTVPAATDGVDGVYRVDVRMARSGTAAVALRWPNADVSLKLYVTSGDCANATDLVAGACTILGAARPGNPPVMVSAPVASGDLNTVWVLNPDPFSQSVTISIVIE